MQLAWQCGYPHCDLMLRRLNSRQYSEVVAMLAIEPIGEERADLRNGQLMAMYVNCLQKEGSKPKTPSEFTTDWWKEPEEEEPQAIDQVTLGSKLMALFGAMKAQQSQNVES